MTFLQKQKVGVIYIILNKQICLIGIRDLRNKSIISISIYNSKKGISYWLVSISSLLYQSFLSRHGNAWSVIHWDRLSVDRTLYDADPGLFLSGCDRRKPGRGRSGKGKLNG